MCRAGRDRADGHTHESMQSLAFDFNGKHFGTVFCVLLKIRFNQNVNVVTTTMGSIDNVHSYYYVLCAALDFEATCHTNLCVFVYVLSIALRSLSFFNLIYVLTRKRKQMSRPS